MKKIYLIRHAESEANVSMDLDNPTHYFDSKITYRGQKQAYKAKEKFKKINFDTYICSPLTRALETFSIIFPEKLPIIQPLIREQLFHSCDIGSQPIILKNNFPFFDFTNLNKNWWNNEHPKNYWWNNNSINEKKMVKESFYDIKVRLDKFKSWLSTFDSSTVAVVSHGTFLNQITGYMLDNCEHYIWEY